MAYNRTILTSRANIHYSSPPQADASIYTRSTVEAGSTARDRSWPGIRLGVNASCIADRTFGARDKGRVISAFDCTALILTRCQSALRSEAISHLASTHISHVMRNEMAIQ